MTKLYIYIYISAYGLGYLHTLHCIWIFCCKQFQLRMCANFSNFVNAAVVRARAVTTLAKFGAMVDSLKYYLPLLSLITCTGGTVDELWNPKVSDFGLAKLLVSKSSYITTHVMGTFGYVGLCFYMRPVCQCG